jgi:UDP-N-acetylglucosamine 2-epimerase (non-hydrolysing)
MHSAGVAAVPLGIPLAHFHGGELTEGAIDDLYRHSLTKLAHLHLVATQSHAFRVRQMGEEPWRVTVTGALALDDLCHGSVLSPEELRRSLGLLEWAPPILVTLHSATRSPLTPLEQAEEVLKALEGLRGPIVVTAPNADPGGDQIRQSLEEFARSRSDTVIVDSVGATVYRSLMATSRIMVGNSSSGIIEAASFRLPVVNVGARQDGRERPANVLDVPYRRELVAAAVRHADEPAFRAGLDGQNPYGDGKAADRAVTALRRGLAETDLLHKRWTVPGVGEFRAL